MVFAVHLFCYSTLQTGREEGWRCRPSQFHVQAGREKHEEKQGWKKKKRQSEQPSLPPLFYCSTLFLEYPLSPTHLVKVQDLSSVIYKQGKYNVDLLVHLSIQQ